MMLDEERIADLRAATGSTASTWPSPRPSNRRRWPSRCCRGPTPQRRVEQVLSAARVVDIAAGGRRCSDGARRHRRDKEVLPSAWLDATRTKPRPRSRPNAARSVRTSRLTASMMVLAGLRARMPMSALERLIARIDREDAVLGRKRPDAMKALMAAVEEKLDVARRLQLARDRWALLAPAYDRYQAEITRPIDLLSTLKPSLDDIKALSGSTPASLAAIESAVSQILTIAAGIRPPQDLAAAHALLVSAAQLAGNAARIRAKPYAAT